MALLYGRAWRLTAKNGDFRPGQLRDRVLHGGEGGSGDKGFGGQGDSDAIDTAAAAFFLRSDVIVRARKLMSARAYRCCSRMGRLSCLGETQQDRSYLFCQLAIAILRALAMGRAPSALNPVITDYQFSPLAAPHSWLGAGGSEQWGQCTAAVC